jgi:hypothetical protein
MANLILLQRDERLGWMGDAGLAIEQAMYNFGGAGGSGGDSAAGVFISWLDMIADEQVCGGAWCVVHGGRCVVCSGGWCIM